MKAPPRRPMRTLLAVCLLLGAFARSSPAVEAPAAKVPAAAQAARLVELLGHDSFDVRERASLDLAALGTAARAALEQGLDSPDAEVRYRCRRILRHVVDIEFKAQLAAFAAGQLADHGAGLPCWPAYRALVGDDPATRELFVAMQRAEGDLLRAASSDGNAASEKLLVACANVQQKMFVGRGRPAEQVSLGTVAALLLAAMQPDMQVADQTVSYLHTFCHQPPVAESLRQGRFTPAMRRLLGAWVGRATDPQASYQNFILALQYDLADGLGAAVDALARDGVPPHVLQFALRVVGKFGDQRHLEDITPLLDDARVCSRFRLNNVEVQTQIRDVALATLVHLTGQSHAQYGFDRLRANQQLLFQPGTVGFSDEDVRDRAIARWVAWHVEHPARPPAAAPPR